MKYFQKQTDRFIQVHNSCQKIDDNDVEHDQECGDTISVSKDSYFNLKRHIMRKHDSVLREHGRPEQNVSILNMVEIGNIG